MLLQRNNHAFEDIQRLFPARDVQGIQHFQKFVAFYLITHHQAVLQHIISGCRQGVEDQHKGLQSGHFIPAFDVGQIPVSYTHLDVYKRQADATVEKAKAEKDSAEKGGEVNG